MSMLPEWKSLACAEVLDDLAGFGPTLNAANRELKGYIGYYNADDLRKLAAACIEAADWLDKRAESEAK